MPSGSSVIQSGVVTPGHIAAWATDGVIEDSGLTFSNTYGMLSVSELANFNSANTDTTLVISLPAGYTRYRISTILISGASAAINSATCGVFTAAAGSGVAVVAGSTAVAVNTSAADTSGNMQQLTIANQTTIAFNDAALFFRVQTANGAPGTASVTVNYEPLP